MSYMRIVCACLCIVSTGRPHYCYFHLMHTEDCVEWFNEKKRIKKALMLRDVIELKTGQVRSFVGHLI